jgi:hypothetical protein
MSDVADGPTFALKTAARSTFAKLFDRLQVPYAIMGGWAARP